jgi:hypothetical protein
MMNFIVNSLLALQRRINDSLDYDYSLHSNDEQPARAAAALKISNTNNYYCIIIIN